MNALSSEPLASLQRRSVLSCQWLVFACGLAVTLLEFCAVRLLAPFFGQSPIVWTNVISVVLLALAAGAWLGGRWSEHRSFRTRLAWLPVFAGSWVVLAAALGPVLARALLPDGFRDGPDPALALLASLEAVTILFAPPLVALGAITPLVLEQLARARQAGRVRGTLLALSTLGAVAGGYLANLVLVPAIGTRRTLLVCAALLFAAALPAAWLAAATRKTSTIAILFALAALAALAASAARFGPTKGAGIAGDHVLYERDSTVQTVRVLERICEDRSSRAPAHTRILALDEGDAEFHSARIEGRVDSGGRYFDTLALLPLLLPPPPDDTFDVLIIGFAAGTLFNELDALLGPSLRCVGVELDPTVLDVAQTHFGLDRADPRLTLVVGDGRVVVNTLRESARFDLVIVDAYAHQTYIPFQIATRECFQALREHLEPAGLLALNVDCRRPAARVMYDLAATIDAARFGPVWIAPVRDYPSAILFCGRDDATPHELARAAPPWLARAAAAFCAMLLRPHPVASDVVFTDDHAPIEAAMHEQLERTATRFERTRTCDVAFCADPAAAPSRTMATWRAVQTKRFEGSPRAALAELERFAVAASARDALWADGLAAEIEATDLANPAAALTRSRARADRLRRAVRDQPALADVAAHAQSIADWYAAHAVERTRASRRKTTLGGLALATLVVLALALVRSAKSKFTIL